jgi:hypothetical protein
LLSRTRVVIGVKYRSNLPKDLDPIFYLELNEDVRTTGIEPMKHHLYFGVHENTIYKPISGIPSELKSALQTNPRTKRPKFANHENIWSGIGQNANKMGVCVGD